jgi:hypothetical protein
MKRAFLRAMSNKSLVPVAGICGLVAAIAALTASYFAFTTKGVFSTALGLSAIFLLLVFFRNSEGAEAFVARLPSGLRSKTFLSLASSFLLALPYSDFLQAVGVVPGLALLAVLSFLIRHLCESSIPGLAGVTVWILAFWLWGEAGRQGFVVMPVDVPSGDGLDKEVSGAAPQLTGGSAERRHNQGSLSFSGDGIANALETEISGFGAGERGNYAQSEAAQILAGPDLITRLFPTHPWYKGTGSHSRQLTGLDTSHVIFNTQIHDLPLGGLYHLLRHIRGKPMIEGQVLIGSNSLTLSLRRSNYEVPCTSSDIAEALIEHITNDRAEITGDSAIRYFRKDRDQAKLPDGGACEGSSLARALAWLDVVPSPRTGEEERIANVSVSRPAGDAQLTELLHFAVLEAMGSLSAERLAYYYDNAAKYESALKQYRIALPALLAEYDDSPRWQRHEIRDRVVEALIRIGDLESELHDREDVAAGAYKVALDLSADGKQRVLARIGYHYLALAQIVKLEGDDGKEQSYCRLQGQLPTKENCYLNWASEHLDLAESLDASRLYEYSGTDHGRDTLGWLYANQAYLQSSLGKRATDQRAKVEASIRRALYHGDPDSRPATFKDGIETPAELFRRNEDLRVAAAAAFVWSRGELNGPFAQSSACSRDPKPVDRLVTPVCHIEELLEKNDRYTINNMILIESQLRDFYRQLPGVQDSPAQKASVCDTSNPKTKAEIHDTFLFLLDALRQYRAGNFHKALSLIETPRLGDCDPAKTVQNFDTAFILSTWQVHVPLEQREAHTQEATRALNAILDSGKGKDGEVVWRALSLRAVREAMCLDSLDSGPCIPSHGSELKDWASSATEKMPGNAYLHANLGIVLTRVASSESSSLTRLVAISEFERAVEINRWDPWLRCLLARAYMMAGDTEDSQNQLHFGQLLDPSRWYDYYNDVHSIWPILVSPMKQQPKRTHKKKP